ncbi:MAG: GtrA family protein [Bdellovibrionota bacterium]
MTNFLLNRHWSFRALDMRWHRQAVRYAITSGLSLVLNAGLAYLFTDIVGIHYSISVVVASAAVGVLFNFPMHRHYVFR